MIWRALLLALLLAAPAEAVQITDLRLNCAGTWLEPGATVTNASCGGQGLWLDARVSGFPVAVDPVMRFALTVDGQLLGEDIRTLPAHLGPIYGTPWMEYDTAGMGWRLPLHCDQGCTGQAVASFAILGGEDPDVPFTLDVPTPEPTTLLLLGTALVALGVALRKAQS